MEARSVASLVWRDLLAVPFVLGETDCWWMACEVSRRLGVDLDALFPLRPKHDDGVGITTFQLDRVDSPEVGDLLLSDPERLGYPSHVSIVVEPGWALSTTKRYGPMCRPIHMTPKELGAWRARESRSARRTDSFCSREGGDVTVTGGSTHDSRSHGRSGSPCGSSANTSPGERSC